MASRFPLKRGDTLPVLGVTLENPDGSAFDLTGATAVRLLVLIDGVTFARQMTIDPDPTTGQVSYAFVPGDWSSSPALKVGEFPMEYEVTGSSSSEVATFPQVGYHVLSIEQDLG
jgi:hypothetical protein